MRKRIYFCIALLAGVFQQQVLAEGTPQMRPTYNDGGFLYILDPSNSNNFAAYGAAVERRLYFRIASTNERVYIGFGRYKTFNMGNDGNINPPNEALPLPNAVPGGNNNDPADNQTMRKLRFRIKDPSNAIVLSEQDVPTSGQGFIGDQSLAAYNRCVAGPAQLVGASGYYAIEFTPAVTGDYYIEFETYRIDNNSVITPRRAMLQLFDITVATGPGGYTVSSFDATTGQVTSVSGSATATAIPGRVWSRAWSLSTGSSSAAYNGRVYPISDDGVVTEINFNGMQPFGFVISCNRDGINTVPATPASNWIINRRSRAPVNSTAAPPHTPLYRIFLQNPDVNQFPSGTIGCLHGANVKQCDQNQPYCINVTAQAQGEVEVIIDLHPSMSSPDGIYTPGTADVRLTENFNTSGPPQTKCLPWNGLDGNGNPVPNGNIQIIVNFQAGRTNLPIWDIENHSNGFIVRLVRPTTNACGQPVAPPKLYWHDVDYNSGSALPGTATDGISNFAGCTPSPAPPAYPAPIPSGTVGCHRFTDRGVNNSNSETINTWWYVAEDKVTIPYYNDNSTFNISAVFPSSDPCKFVNGDFLDVEITFSDNKFSLSNLNFTINPTLPGYSFTHPNAPYTPVVPNALAGASNGPGVVSNTLIGGTPVKRKVVLRYRVSTTTTLNDIGYSFSVSTNSCGSTLSDSKNILCSQLMPVELVSFSGVNKGRSNILKWSTAWELNNKGFFIERSEDGIHFHRIGFVQAAGNGNLLTYYQYVDELERIQTYYYRLRQEDYDQSFTYSKIIAIVPSDDITGSVELYQEGNKGTLYLRSQLEDAASLVLELYNVSGAKVSSLPIEVPAGSYVQPLDLPVLAKGLYVAQVLHKKVPIARQKILLIDE